MRFVEFLDIAIAAFFARRAFRKQVEERPLGTLNIPRDQMKEIKGKRMTIKVDGRDIRRVNPNSAFMTEWKLWGSRFMPYQGVYVDRLIINCEVIDPGATLPCKYRKDGKTYPGLVTIVETREWM